MPRCRRAGGAQNVRLGLHVMRNGSRVCLRAWRRGELVAPGLLPQSSFAAASKPITIRGFRRSRLGLAACLPSALLDHFVGTPKQRQRDIDVSALAVFRLTVSSTVVTCTTGRSPGFSPFRIAHIGASLAVGCRSCHHNSAGRRPRQIPETDTAAPNDATSVRQVVCSCIEECVIGDHEPGCTSTRRERGKAGSNSFSVLALRTWSWSPSARAASCKSLVLLRRFSDWRD